MIGNNEEIKLGHKLVYNYLISELFSEDPAEARPRRGKTISHVKGFPEII